METFEEHVHTLEEDIKFIVDSGYTFNITCDKDGVFGVCIDSLIFPTGERCLYPSWSGVKLKPLMDEATGYIDQQNQYKDVVLHDYFYRGNQELKEVAEKILEFEDRKNHV